MKISFPLHNGTFQFDGTYEEFEKLLETQLTIYDIMDDDEDDEDVKNYAETVYRNLTELFEKVGTHL